MGVIQVVRGRQRSAARVVIYGTEGIGKTSLAAQFPEPLILDTENGSKHLDCSRAHCPDWKALTLAIAELTIDAQGFRTVVVDSADWAEKHLIEWLLKTSGKKSIEDFGFGKGYTMLQEHVVRFLASCDQLVAQGIHVVLVAHSKVQRTSPPDQTDGFDRYELKLTKQVAPLLKEWCDLLLFANYKTRLVEGADGRMKATGGKTRVMYAERSAAYDAKNRYGLPEEMPMAIEHLAVVVQGPVAQPRPEPERAAPPPATLFGQISDYIEGAKDLRTLGKIGDRIDALSSDGQLSHDQVTDLVSEIDRKHNQIQPQEAGV